jgi:tetratricopeptide (TPR) repeat protein
MQHTPFTLLAIYLHLCLGAFSLAPVRAAETWDRDAVYNQRVAELKKAIADRPTDAGPLVDLAAFYLKPLAPRTIEAADGVVRTFLVPLRNEVTPSIKNIIAVPWVMRGDTSAAWPLLSKALELDPKNIRAMREMAMYYRMRGDLDRMKPHMEAALNHNPADLDMCRLFLDHRTAVAYNLDEQATMLRTPRSWEEQRSDGRYRVTQQPSAADYARADALNAQAQEARRQAIKPLQNLAGMLKNDPALEKDAAKRSKWRLATAIYADWIGELEKAAGTAGAALREDPTNLDALDFVVDIMRLTHTKDKLETYKAILDRWGGADSSPVILKPKPVLPKK